MQSDTPVGQPEAASQESTSLQDSAHSSSPDVLERAASHSQLTEDLALTLLKRSDLPSECLVTLSKNGAVAKYRKVRAAIVQHLRTPRHVSLPMLRLLYTFDLMQVALTPVVAADVKRAAEEVLLAKLDTISSGEKLTLARRASGRIAAELLVDKEARVMQAALDNPRLTEVSVARVLASTKTSSALVETACHHPKWSRAREIRIALLRNEKTPLARALEFARSLAPQLLHEILHNSRLPASTKAYLLRQIELQPRPEAHRPAGR